jgi:nicotinate dehydrogenase subunit B
LTRIRRRLGIDLFQRFFEQIVELCQDARLVWGRQLYVDATKVEANADLDSLVPRFSKEEVTTDEHLVTSLDWSTYHILTFPEVPTEIRVELINRPEDPVWGAGEISICPMGAAIGNAIFDATGVRLRTLPYTPDRVLAALRGA